MPSPKAALARVRAKRPGLDHLIQAFGRYQADTGDRLAAAVTFFGFLSFFPLLALAASLLAVFIGPDAVDTVVREVDNYAPGLAEQLMLEDLLTSDRAAGVAGAVGLVGLLYSGLGWVDALREAIRSIWHQNVQAGNLIKKKLADVLVLAGLGLLLVVSLGTSAVASALTGFALETVGLEDSLVATVVVRVVGIALAVLTSTALFLYLFFRLPKVQTPWRRVVRGAALAAVLFEVLKLVGAFYIARTTGNPVYGIVAVAVGLLVWINLVSKMLLLCAAWTVTAPYDADVAPSGTASPEQAAKAGIPLEYADSDMNLTEDGAPTPLVAAVQGRTPPQFADGGPGSEAGDSQADDSQGRGEQASDTGGASGDGTAGRTRATASPPTATADLPGAKGVVLAARSISAVAAAGLAALAVYVLRTVWGYVRR